MMGGIKPSRGKVAVCSVLALFLGLLHPITQLFQAMMPMPTVCAALVITTVMYASAGMIPAGIYGAAAIVSSALFFGMLPSLAVTLMWVVPTVVMIQGMCRKQPFFRQLMRGIVAAVAAAALAMIGFTLIFGQDMIAKAIDQLRNTFSGQQELFWEALSPMFRTPAGEISKEAFVEVYYEMFNMLQVYYEYYLLANMLGGAAISAIICVLWGNWLFARRGEATPDSFRGLGELFLPSNATFGILITLAASRLLVMTPLPSAESAWIVVSSLGALAFAVQCMAAMDRRMKNNGSSVNRRIVLLVLLTVFGSTSGAVFFGMEMMDLLAVIGCASALFGRRGAVRPWIQKIKNNMDGEDR